VDFLDLLTTEAAREPSFTLTMNAEAEDLIVRDGVVRGLRWTDADGTHETEADLVVAADGRSSALRAAAGLVPVAGAPPMDVLWFRLSRGPSAAGAQTGGYVRPGLMLVAINRDKYWQCGYVIPKGAADEVRAAGLPAFRERLARLLPWMADRVHELAHWDQVKLLTVQIDCLKQWWRPGLLCIGDAAHAMSPVGGVGINIAIQDAVAAGNFLSGGDFSPANLRRIQRRRQWPARATQRLQILAQDRIISRVLQSRAPLEVPLGFRLLGRFAWLRRLPGRLIGMGLRPEHVAASQHQ
jgi:2-polyprenyl-6-methoxyphenol hydroxylase-like FAD-dependent oxidoreductase